MTARTQRAEVLQLLRDNAIVKASDLVYEHKIPRAAAVIHALRQEGYEIETLPAQDLPGGARSSATYRLVREPLGQREHGQETLW